MGNLTKKKLRKISKWLKSKKGKKAINDALKPTKKSKRVHVLINSMDDVDFSF